MFNRFPYILPSHSSSFSGSGYSYFASPIPIGNGYLHPSKAFGIAKPGITLSSYSIDLYGETAEIRTFGGVSDTWYQTTDGERMTFSEYIGWMRWTL
jgi:hypothetical protein